MTKQNVKTHQDRLTVILLQPTTLEVKWSVPYKSCQCRQTYYWEGETNSPPAYISHRCQLFVFIILFVRHLKSRNKTERTIILQNKIKTKGKQILFILNETHFNKSFLFRFIRGNIPAAPAYGVYISQLTRYSREPSNTNLT
jgi:hypothetical protein